MNDKPDGATVESLRELLGDPPALLARMKDEALAVADVMHAPVFLAAAELNAEDSAYIRVLARAAREGLPKKLLRN
ncbi:hypothetical protein BOC50_25355 [Burkholderia pseudomallei]|uniref:hypothetical protein n=1 Tax=Burkholderia pseudomallei TaxID=28450 RepID=UPI000A1A233F|nr:hypothetical protein [Burkholderia pseudomallei]ARL46294.1 hypothetical protein BOC50_25355 [Burkholderia pseudomallei]